jgi:hypothetical protein
MKRIVVAMFLVISACQRQDSAATDTATATEMSTDTAQSEKADLARMQAAPTTGAAAANAPSPAVPRMIVRKASISVIVRDSNDVLQKVTTLVEAKQGYVAATRRWKEREQVRAAATLRVPAQQLAPVLTAIRGLAIRVETEEIKADDVSEEYSDLGAQLRNLTATETELIELLKTVRERTQKASEVLEVHREISKVRGEIDRIQGRRQFLAQQTALSTIELELVPDVLAAPVVEPGWQPVATIRKAARALIIALKAIVDLLIWAVLYLLPLAIIVALVVLILRPLWFRLRDFSARLERDKKP